MVCSIGSAKMAVVAQLSTGKFSHSITEKAGRQKLVAQYIQKELLEADVANLLDEEDMHIYDSNPVTDPLNLVCCNSCKKPVKASQFAIHAELCRSLGIAEELISERDGGTVNRKIPRKERKKSVNAEKRLKLTEGQNIFATLDASEIAVSCSQLDERVGFTSCLVEAKGAPGAIAGLCGERIPLAKCPKLIAADTAQPSDDIQTAQSVSNIIHLQDANTYIRYIPTPLASKTYYSQRNNRLQAAISHMYQHVSMKNCSENEREWQGNLVITEACALRSFPEGQYDDQVKKNHVRSSPITQNTNRNFRQGSSVSSLEAGGQPSNNFVNQFFRDW